MNKKFVGFIVCSLLIIATVLPVAGNIKVESNSPSRAISTYVDTISPYNQPSNPLEITATGPSDLDAVELHYRWSSNNITWTGLVEHSIFEGFESGSQNTSLWSTYQSIPGNARIQWNYGNSHGGSYSCAMDDNDQQQSDYEKNVIFTNFDFSDSTEITIDFWQRHWDDEAHNGISSWNGWTTSASNLDCVAYTNDGNTWYRIITANDLNHQVWTQFEYDISNHEDFSSPADSNFAIAFTQYDNYQLTQDGRAWDDITIEYSTGAPSHDWEFWGVDTSYPWSWNFNFPDDDGYYEFYTIGKKTGELDESPPTSADAICRFNEDPEIFNEVPEDGSVDVPRVPDMEISVSDAEEETMDIKWYSNSEGSWEVFATNIGVEDGTYSQTNENFSEYSTTYYWYVTVSDDIYTIQSPTWSFTTEANQPPYTPNSPSPADGETNVNINKVLTWIGGDPNPGDSVKYDVYFGKSSSPPLVAEDVPQSAYVPGTLDLETKYYWRIDAEDEYGLTANGPLWEFTTQSEPNDPPEAPDIYGPPSGPPSKQLFWAFSSFDPDGHDVKYIIDWGDGDTHETGYYEHSKAVEASHTYSELGDYTIVIKAEDENGLQGPESSFDVTITRSKTANQRLMHILFERFPLLERLMNLFIFR
jgi:hypothetical protein